MSNTPETDAESCYPDSNLGECVCADFARKLERERDEAREENAKLRDIAKRAINIPQIIELADGTKCVRLEDFLRECDEAREKIERQANRIRYLEGATNHACGTPLSVALRERDEARGALERISHASMNARHKEEDYAEWEKAVFVLLDICEERKVK